VAALCAALALAPAWPAPAAARVFRPCGEGVDCGRVVVPLDRAGRAKGTLRLEAIRVRARSRRASRPRDAVVALSGGPGEAALPFAVDFLSEMYPALRTRDLLLWDQRGTGGSSPVRCPRFQRGVLGGLATATRECIQRLGTAAFSYNTEEAVRDIEAVRIAAGARKLTLYGVSYGTKVALVYAALFPERVERLVLDSVVDPLGPDPFDLDLFRALPRVMRETCAGGRCRGVTTDPVADLRALVERMARSPLRGHLVGGDGRRRARSMGRSALLDLLVEGDFDPAGRSLLPAAVRSALAGDPAPLLRVVHLILGRRPPEPLRLFDVGTFVATSCADQGFPWSPAAALDRRWPPVLAAADAIPEAAMWPFDRATARGSVLLRTCARWPPIARAPVTPVGPLPDVPTLLLSGSADMRTPVEAASALAARQPRAAHLIVPGAGHGVLPNDISGCAGRAVREFFSGRPVSPGCPRSARPLLRLLGPGRADPVAPVALESVAPVAGLPMRVGRTIRAVGLALLDLAALEELVPTESRVLRIGGLRGGRAVVRQRPRETVQLERYSYVRGVRVSMPAKHLDDPVLRLRVAGSAAAHGSLRFDFRSNRIGGRLGGRRIGLRLARQLGDAVRGLYSDGPPGARSTRRAVQRLTTPVP
jgi:pimeloyl-ACP methyl ester carboxylesterase